MRECAFKVSTPVSRVMGKRACSRHPRYTLAGKDYCMLHINHAKGGYHERLVRALEQAIKGDTGMAVRVLAELNATPDDTAET